MDRNYSFAARKTNIKPLRVHIKWIWGHEESARLELTPPSAVEPCLTLAITGLGRQLTKRSQNLREGFE